jgi:putative N6-adenine-specific DNA methylase
MIAQNITPGINRDFAFFQWPIHQKDLWPAHLRAGRQGILPNQSPITGFDRDRGAIEAARSNAARAGLLDRITFVQQAISYLEPPAPEGWIITNPPYGVRVSENKDLRDLYARFGAIFLHRFSSWSLAVLTTDDLLVSAMGLGEPKQKIHLVNGGIPVHLSLFPH